MDVYLYLERDSAVHRMDPRAKLFVLLMVFAMAVLCNHPLPLLVLLVLVLAAGQVARVLANLRRIWVMLATIGVLSTIIWSFWAGGRTRLVGPVELEAFLYGLATGLKLDTMIIAGMLFLSTTRNEEITAGLIRLGTPFAVSFAFSTALRLVPTFIGASVTVIQAQKSRGLDVSSGGFFSRVRKQFPMLVPVFVCAIRGTNQLAMALESKGFGAQRERTYYLEIGLGRLDYAAMVASAALLGLTVFLKLRGWLEIPGLIR
ncbi:MAG: energy-coupling factor transporter transmembrane component T [Bacillota bacterium]|nr:energy-coupling factor transporter transmembrane component T [Bacillota bacterium]MDI7249446.1 energy-coupling factor transporter transmembrane component T [Bacillota bacterium]